MLFNINQPKHTKKIKNKIYFSVYDYNINIV